MPIDTTYAPYPQNNAEESVSRPPGFEDQSSGVPSSDPAGSDMEVAEENAVRRWTGRIHDAKAKWEADFKRMRKNMEFVAGLQWDQQADIDDPENRYICNLTLRMVEQKVAQLYARNPEAEAIRRERLDFSMWDGTIEHLQDAYTRMQQAQMTGVPDIEAGAIMQDFMNGRQMQALVDRICKTLKVSYQYIVDSSRPDFKEQMKQLVRRTVIAGVGYCRPSFVRNNAGPLSTVETRHTMVDRAKSAQYILSRVEAGEVDEQSPDMDVLRSLVLSMGQSMQVPDEHELNERIEFDFLPATSVIPDIRCRSLKEFTAARWVAIEYRLPAAEVNAFFGLSGDDAIQPGGSLVAYDREGEVWRPEERGQQDDPMNRTYVCLWEILDYTTRCQSFIVEGWKKYIQQPTPLSPSINGFWPIFALTFNDHESDERTKATPFPQSDVFLIRHAQMEWNRTRSGLRDHRNANAPTYLVRKGVLTDEDRHKIATREPNEVVELEALPQDTTPEKAVGILQVAPIDPMCYDTRPLEQDMQLSAGVQQADLGPAMPNVTATVGTIAEQSRLTVTSSNVDDLDGFLSRLAQACGEMMLQAMDEQTVKRIAGPGAVWPTVNREEFLNSIVLTIKAASSGRPNKAIETANYMQIAPVLLQAGANPLSVIEEGVKRMDDRLDVSKFFPMPGQMAPQGAGVGQPPVTQPGPMQDAAEGQVQRLPNGAVLSEPPNAGPVPQ